MVPLGNNTTGKKAMKNKNSQNLFVLLQLSAIGQKKQLTAFSPLSTLMVETTL
jgi:hypothetical protein